MTVSTTDSSIAYTENGVTTAFPVPFRFLNDSDLAVTSVSTDGTYTTLSLGSDYTLTGSGSQNGGTLTRTVAGANGSTLNIARNMPVVQQTDLRNQGRFFAETLESAYDYLTMLIQQAFTSMKGVLRVAVGDPEPARLPNVAARAGKLMAFDANGNPTAVIPVSGSSADLALQLASTANVAFGDAMIAVKQPTTNAAPTNQHQVNLERVSIQQYGSPRAADDYNGTTGTNSFPALLAIIADFPNGCVIRLPRTIGGTGRYFMSGSTGSADMSKYVIEPDPGVDVTHAGTATPLIGPGLVSTRPMKIRMSSLGYNYYISARPYGEVASKPYTLSAGDGESPIVERLITDLNVNLTFNSVNISTGAQAPVTPTGADGETASFASISTTGFTVGSFAIRPGQEFHAQVTMPSMTGSVAAYVQTENGWILFSQDQTGGAISRYVFLEGFSVQSTTFANPLDDALAYRMANTEIGIKVHSPTSFSLLLNHTEIARMDGITSNIIRAGWGAGLVNNTNPAYITYPVRWRKHRTFGMRQLKGVFVGDSTADKVNPFSWVNHFLRTVSGVGGIQFKTVLNQAVAGQTSAQQLAIVQATNYQSLGGFDFMFVDIGVNDIGGAVDSTTYVNNLVAMYNVCVTYNITLLIGLPSMFYNQSEALTYGQTGQNTGNAERGAIYRLKLERKVAELGLNPMFLSFIDMGAVVPSMLANSALNPMVQDNIHQSNFGAEVKGMGAAKSFLGYLFPEPRKDIATRAIKPAWIPSAISATYGVASKPSFRVNGDQLAMSGIMDTPASVPVGTVLLNMPQPYAPQANLRVSVVCADVSNNFNLTGYLLVSSTGSISVLSMPATSRYIDFGSINFTMSS